jgi:Protein of unknown function (DUF2924)
MPRSSFDGEAIEAEIDHIRSLGVDALRSLWCATFRTSPPPAFTKDLIARFLSWHLQEQAFGGLDPQIAKHLTSLARGDRSRGDRPRRLKPGTVLVREYQGARHTVMVVANGFVWREATYASLSTIARAITGTNWNGPRFFGLGSTRRQHRRRKPTRRLYPPMDELLPRPQTARPDGRPPQDGQVGPPLLCISRLAKWSPENEAGRSKTPMLCDLYPQIERT